MSKKALARRLQFLCGVTFIGITELAMSDSEPFVQDEKTTIPRVPLAVVRSNHRTQRNRGWSLRKNRPIATSHGAGLLCCAPGHSQLRGCPDQEGVSGRDPSLACAEAAPPGSQPNSFPTQFRVGNGHLSSIVMPYLACAGQDTDWKFRHTLSTSASFPCPVLLPLSAS